MTAGRDQKGSLGLPGLVLALLLLAAPRPGLGQESALLSPSGESVPAVDLLAVAPAWNGQPATAAVPSAAREDTLLSAWHTPLASLERRQSAVEVTSRTDLQ